MKYKQQKRYVVRCLNCRAQFVTRTTDGNISAQCPRCGHLNTRTKRPPVKLIRETRHKGRKGGKAGNLPRNGK